MLKWNENEMLLTDSVIKIWHFIVAKLQIYSDIVLLGESKKGINDW